ncbi:MAG: hypothetical protein KDD64_14490 [Bdellovibrionales bacterium]|nr:hypothetical protein [Bdellovibrionales bacterium]
MASVHRGANAPLSLRDAYFSSDGSHRELVRRAREGLDAIARRGTRSFFQPTRKSTANEEFGLIHHQAAHAARKLFRELSSGTQSGFVSLLLALTPERLPSVSRAYLALTGEKLFDHARLGERSDSTSRLEKAFGLSRQLISQPPFKQRSEGVGGTSIETLRIPKVSSLLSERPMLEVILAASHATPEAVCELGKVFERIDSSVFSEGDILKIAEITLAGTESFSFYVNRLLSAKSSCRFSGNRVDSILLSRDAHGVRLLDRLHNLISLSLGDELAEHRQLIVSDLVKQIAFPGRSTQGELGTCKAETVLFRPLVSWPAEYARLASGLFSQLGLVEMAGGEILARSTAPLTKYYFGHRSLVDSILQAAIMEFANGDNLDYCVSTDRHIPVPTLDKKRRTLTADRGLTSEETRTVLEALFDEPYVVFSSKKFAANFLTSVIEQLKGQHTVVSLAWEEGGRRALHGLHAVCVTHVTKDRVFFHNPWGPSLLPSGTLVPNPSRRIERSDNGLESMSREEFTKRIRVIVAPVKQSLRSLHSMQHGARAA